MYSAALFSLAGVLLLLGLSDSGLDVADVVRAISSAPLLDLIGKFRKRLFGFGSQYTRRRVRFEYVGSTVLPNEQVNGGEIEPKRISRHDGLSTGNLHSI